MVIPLKKNEFQRFAGEQSFIAILEFNIWNIRLRTALAR
jgi:hypothetical protein